MRFDDRLSTVLTHPARTDHDRVVRWRQLVDLLSRAGSLEGSAHAQSALNVIQSDAPHVDLQLRAAAARAIAALPMPFELVSLFVQDSLKVSAPILAAARLQPEEWRALLESADREAARFIRTLHPGLDDAAHPPAEPSRIADSRPHADLSIEEVINRIEAVRASRVDPAAPPRDARGPEPYRPPSAEPVPGPGQQGSDLFRWECGPSGELEWVDGAPRGALIGRPLVDPAHDRESGSGEIARAFAARAPFSNALLSIAEETVLAGEWEVSGMPAFEHSSGRFAGYRGVAKRVRAPGSQTALAAAIRPDVLRELVHEIKTPLNAIMGFAEIIQTQMFGPAGHTYRSRASEIVAQSHLLLSAIDDLDLAAKLQAGTYSSEIETDIADLLEELLPGLEDQAQSAGVELRLLVEPHLPPCSVGPAVVERMLQRMVGALIDCSQPSERLQLSASQWNESCTLSVDRPAALKNVCEEDLLDPNFAVPRQRNARLSLGFSLRLVRGIAQLSGGDLMISRRKVTLLLARGDLRPPASGRYRRSAGQGL